MVTLKQTLLVMLGLILALGCDQHANGPILPKESDNPASSLTKGGNTVEVPAGSNDALAGAIAAAGPQGTVVLKSGLHFESGTVTISIPINIVGEPGAELEIDTQPLPPAAAIDPALYVINTKNVTISGIEFKPKDSVGGTAIMIENSRQVRVNNNKITDHQFGILLEHGDQARIDGNTIIGSSAWLTGALSEVHGIIVVNGEHVKISQNDISQCLFGIWACDEKGHLTDNQAHGNFIGIILCKVPLALPAPGGQTIGSENSATAWQVKRNDAHDNFDTGYLVIDGANNNHLTNNAAANNGSYDVELAGDSMRFGFLTPASFENRADTDDLLTKDCGDNNMVRSTNLVNTTVDPCF